MKVLFANLRTGRKSTFQLLTSAGMAALLLVLALAAGCGSGSSPESSAEPPAAATAQPAPQQADPATSVPAAETIQQAEPTQPTQPTEPSAASEAASESTAKPAPTAPAVQSAGATAQPAVATEPQPEPEPTVAIPVPTEVTIVPETEPAGEGGGYVVGEGSEATFTVNEKLAWLDLPNDAVMKTVGLSGSIFLDGQPSAIELDLHSMTSDADRRDGYVRNRMFPNDRVAIFTVTDLGDLPDPLPEGEVIAREVQGELFILGVTKPVVFEIEARLDPGKLFVLGRTTFTWDELEIPPPNIPGRIQVQDEVKVEVLLAAIPAGG